MENAELNAVCKHLTMPESQQLFKKINFSLASYTRDYVIASCSLHVCGQDYFGCIKEDVQLLKPVIFQ